MAKTGRPKAEQPKKKTIAIRLTDVEYERVQAYAAKTNSSITQILHEKLDEIIKEDQKGELLS